MYHRKGMLSSTAPTTWFSHDWKTKNCIYCSLPSCTTSAAAGTFNGIDTDSLDSLCHTKVGNTRNGHWCHFASFHWLHKRISISSPFEISMTHISGHHCRHDCYESETRYKHSHKKCANALHNPITLKLSGVISSDNPYISKSYALVLDSWNMLPYDTDILNQQTIYLSWYYHCRENDRNEFGPCREPDYLHYSVTS